MKSDHGTGSAQEPDLTDFVPGQTEARTGGAPDIYGCGKARREGKIYSGVAVTHAVFEHGNRFFTGWTFSDRGACSALAEDKSEAGLPETVE